MAAIIGGGLALAGGVMQGAGSKKAGNQAAKAAGAAAQTQKEMYLQTRADLSPYNTIGQTASGNALSLAQGSPTGGGPDYVGMAGAMFPGGLGGGLPGGGMSQAELEATPGYQFTRDQGLKAVQSAAASRALGVSGASLKGAATYATNLANTTYKTQFDIANQKFADVLSLNTAQQGNLTNQFDRYNKLAGLGENAAAQTGVQGASLANAAGNYTNAAGVDQATGLKNATNALAGGVNNYLGYNAYNNAMNPPTAGYGNSAAGTSGISASGNPVMTGFAAPIVPGQVLPGGYTG